MYIGIDLGTSGVKTILMSENGAILATESVSLNISRPKPLWSEQNPEEWWQATCESIQKIGQYANLSQVKAIGLSGQMHGATLLDTHGEVIRPAILWNDGRCEEECKELERAVPNSRNITGNIMMPGFTAPKLKWVANYEPEHFQQINKVLLPKDYLRFKMTGDYASDMSDSAGTCWLDVRARDWSNELLSATGLTREQMPTLYEGTEATGTLSSEIASQWGMGCVPVVAGAGDNAAGAIGVGIVNPGQAMLSLGTSGVYFAVSDGFTSNTDSALHSFCHALPNTWHTMSVILSAASCLQWVAELTGYENVGTMLTDVEQNVDSQSEVIFLPYLSGERTPHNDPNAKGVFFGMSHSTSKRELAQSVLEGVAFAFTDGFDALHQTKIIPEEISLIGGGAKSVYWRQMLANITGMPLVYREGGDIGPALGAARLAILGTSNNRSIDDVCPVPKLVKRHEPDLQVHQTYQSKREKYQALYASLKHLF